MHDIVAALELQVGSVFFELGSGDGRIVLAAAKLQPGAKCTGIEFALAPTIMTWFAYKKAGKPLNASFRKEDMFKVDLSEATHIFCYLFPQVMADLHEKFKRELKPGTRVVACDFKILSKEPLKTIALSQKAVLGKKLYVYEY